MKEFIKELKCAWKGEIIIGSGLLIIILGILLSVNLFKLIIILIWGLGTVLMGYRILIDDLKKEYDL